MMIEGMKPQEVFAIRRTNLKTLIDRYFNGQQTRLADALDCSSSQISRMMKPPSPESSWRRNMSEETARKIEDVLQLPVGWMDRSVEEVKNKRPVTPVHTCEPAAIYYSLHHPRVGADHQALIDEIVELLLHQPPEHIRLIRELLALLPRS